MEFFRVISFIVFLMVFIIDDEIRFYSSKGLGRRTVNIAHKTPNGDTRLMMFRPIKPSSLNTYSRLILFTIPDFSCRQIESDEVNML